MSESKGILEKIHIKKFRKFKDITISCGSKLTVIAGQNGTQKTTLLGLLAHPFSMSQKNPEKDNSQADDTTTSFYEYPTLLGHKFQSKFANKFKFDKNREKAKDHEYTLYFKDKSIGDNGEFTLESIYRDRRSESLRIWKKGSRDSGDGYIKLPVIYLSLKRVTPIGEEPKISSYTIAIEDDELRYLHQEYKELMLSPSEASEDYITNKLDSTNKKQLVSHPATYSELTVSAGQDNIGTILTAVLSFKRLKEKFPEKYKGGLLFIDEIESTLFPAVQKKLIERLIKYAGKYNLQIFCTTHSPTIINTALNDKYKEISIVNYLKSIDGKILVESDLTAKQMFAHLSLNTPEFKKPKKIRVYSEDNEARLFLKSLLPREQRSLLEIINITLGAQELIRLKDQKINEFTHNIILLDGDQKNTSKNVLCLPGDAGPDKLLYDYLMSLQDGDDFWPDNKRTGEYSKQICFMNYTQIPRDRTEGDLRKFYKQWFTEQVEGRYWGKSNTNAFNRWKKDNAEAVSDFEKAFKKVYNYVAQKNGKPKIE